MKTRFFFAALLSMAFLSGIAQTTGPEIKFDKIEHNYGDIKENGGKANHKFIFTNTGDDTLILTKVQPGCGCTASDWTKDPVLPGKQGMVTAAYDPLGRPGAFKKSILVVSNAKSSPNISLFISGNVIPKPKDFTDTFRVHLGDLLVNRNNPVFHNMRFDEVRTDTIRFYNNSATDMELSVKESPAHIKAVLSTNKLKPAQRGFLLLTFDAGKANTQGNRNDRVMIQTNDAKQDLKMIFVTANILEAPPKPTVEQIYPFQMGNLRLTRNSVSFPELMNTEKKTDSVVMYNGGSYPITIQFKEIPKMVSPSMSNPVIEPGKTSVLKLIYDGTKTEGFGFLTNDRLYIQTNDSLQPLKVLYISANVKEDFSKLTPKQRANAPKITIEEKIFDFGTKPSGPPISHSFMFSNTGKSDLIIRSVQASCGCTATKPEKTVLKPGETSKIDMTFDTKSRLGNQFKSITVITNDPDNAVVMLQVKGNLEAEQK